MKEIDLIGGGGFGPRYLYPKLGYKPLSEKVGAGI
jgi:hypothetical protein